MKWCWVQRCRMWCTLLPGLLCWYWHIAWSGLEQWQELQVFIFIATEAVIRDQSKIQYVKKIPQTTSWANPWNINSSDWLDIWVIYSELIYIVPFNMQHKMSWCPGHLQLYKGYSSKKKVVVPKSQLGKSHWVGLVLHWGWENVPQVWEHRCDLKYN